MSEQKAVVVTRAHREAWHFARYGHVPEDGHPRRQWCTDGVDPHDTQAAIAIMNRGAQAIADAEARGFERAKEAMMARVDAEGPAVIGKHLDDAEARGRAAERADVVAWLRSDGVGLYAPEGIERGEHVGAAGGRPTP